jgi:hypothetical protein
MKLNKRLKELERVWGGIIYDERTFHLAGKINDSNNSLKPQKNIRHKIRNGLIGTGICALLWQGAIPVIANLSTRELKAKSEIHAQHIDDYHEIKEDLDMENSISQLKGENDLVKKMLYVSAPLYRNNVNQISRNYHGAPQPDENDCIYGGENK